MFALSEICFDPKNFVIQVIIVLFMWKAFIVMRIQHQMNLSSSDSGLIFQFCFVVNSYFKERGLTKWTKCDAL
jgi:hypothetical protein